jgi:hypothetical protein
MTNPTSYPATRYEAGMGLCGRVTRTTDTYPALLTIGTEPTLRSLLDLLDRELDEAAALNAAIDAGALLTPKQREVVSERMRRISVEMFDLEREAKQLSAALSIVATTGAALPARALAFGGGMRAGLVVEGGQ